MGGGGYKGAREKAGREIKLWGRTLKTAQTVIANPKRLGFTLEGTDLLQREAVFRKVVSIQPKNANLGKFLIGQN